MESSEGAKGAPATEARTIECRRITAHSSTYTNVSRSLFGSAY